MSRFDADDAIEALRRGEVVGLPTDTVYGLAASATLPGASSRLFALKRRPDARALPVLVADLAQALTLVRTPAPRFVRLAEHFWPGPLTIVVRRAARFGPALGGDGTTVGLRCPDDDVLRGLAQAVGPLAVTSANRHGEAPCESAQAVEEVFGAELRVVLDGGERAGTPSTVVSLVEREPTLLRAGATDFAEVLAVLG